MKFTVEPHRLHYCSICELQPACSMFYIILVMPLEFLSIHPTKYTLSVHHVIFPLPLIVPSIAPCILSESLNLVVLKFALVDVTCWPGELSLHFTSFLKNATKNSAINPLLFSSAVHFIVTPLPIIDHALIVMECASSLSPAVNPISNIEIFIFMDKQPLAFECSIFKLADIEHQVLKNKTSFAFRLHFFVHFSKVNG